MSTKLPRIFLVKGNYGMTGGPETLLSNILRFIDADRYRPHLVLLNREGVPLSSVLKDVTLPVERTVLNWPGFARAFSVASRLDLILKSRNAALLHTHDMRANLTAFLLRRRYRIPWISHVHGWLGATHSGRWRLYERVDQWLVKAADLVLVGSHKARRESLGSGVRRVEVVPNGVPIPPLRRFSQEALEIRRALFPKSSGVVVGMVGRIHRGKGQEILIRAISKLIQHGTDVHGLVVGEGPDLERLRVLVRDLDLESRVVLSGYCEDIKPYVMAMDVFVVPSLNESLPLTALEAMALERPIVASRVGDLPRVIQDGKNGLLVSPGSVHELFLALRRMSTDRQLRLELGSNARKRITDSYSVDATTRSLEKIYSELLGERQHDAGKS